MEPMRKALDAFERHREAIIARWDHADKCTT